MARKILRILLKTLASLVFVALVAIIATSVSAVYNFDEPKPFSGPDIFNPYRNIDTAHCWKRANFHTHTRVKGIFNECEKWPAEVYDCYEKLNYDIVTFSNHNELTTHPFDSALQVNVYEHGYNLFKYHKLVFGCEKVNRFDHLLPLFAFQKQFQLYLLGDDSEVMQLNHPLRTNCLTKSQLQKLNGYHIMELDSGMSTENEYWDWALSAGHYSFGLANDDLHFPDRSAAIAVRCNFLCTPSASWQDLKNTLLDGCYYSMRVPDYGNGDWSEKYEQNRTLPFVKNIGLKDSVVYIALSERADSIKIFGQDHKTCSVAFGVDSLGYAMTSSDPYARFTVYFPDGEVLYSNPFARYDASQSESPFVDRRYDVNVFLTILFNLALLILLVGTGWCFVKLIKR